MFSQRIDDHLALRLITTRDAEQFYAILERDRERLAEFLPWVDTTNSVEDERASMPLWAAFDPDKQIGCALTLDGVIIGSIGLVHIARPERWAEIGYWIDSIWEGRGYVTAAVRELERLSFTELGLERIQIRADVANTRSRAVPERLGYTLEGILRRANLTGHGQIADHSLYSLLKPEWEAREGLGAHGREIN